MTSIPDMPSPRVLQWWMDSGCLRMTFPAEMLPAEVDEVAAVLAITVDMMRRSAQAVEARREAAKTGSVDDESAVLKGCAPSPAAPAPQQDEL